MKLHELLDYIRPTQTITVRYGEGCNVIDEKPYNKITLIEAYDYMHDEVIELGTTIDGVLVVTIDEGEDY